MKKRTIKFLSIAVILCIIFTFPSYAHSGRTDSSGGHRDNKNKSGLGYYHYHCGGYPAHLHTNGICPYKDISVEDNSTTSSTTSTNYESTTEKKPQIIATDIKTIIDEKEVPTFYYNGKPGGTVIIAEDLQKYGFDKTWNQDTKTLILTRDISKEITFMDMEYYNKLNLGQVLYDVVESDIKVILKTSADSEEIQATKFYNLNGYIAISTDELKHFGSISWDNTTRKLTVSLN